MLSSRQSRQEMSNKTAWPVTKRRSQETVRSNRHDSPRDMVQDSCVTKNSERNWVSPIACGKSSSWQKSLFLFALGAGVIIFIVSRFFSETS